MVSRETHVSHMMLRSLCGCCNNKVDDKDIVVVKDYRDTVFVYASHKVLARSLIGALFRTLEKRDLKPTGINMLKPSKELVQKSGILGKGGRGSSYESEVCLVSLWHGDEAFRNVTGAISYFCRNYAFIPGVDLIMTESTMSTRKQAELWIDTAPPPPPLPPPLEATTEDIPTPEGELADVEEEQATVIEAHNAEHGPSSPSELPYQPIDNEVLVRDSSTADTLPVGDKEEPPLDVDKLPPIAT